jgi:hypothetical protein
MNDDLEAIATYPSAFEAELVRDFLGSKHILAFIADAATGRIIRPGTALPAEGIQILVRKEDVYRAEEALDSVDI